MRMTPDQARRAMEKSIQFNRQLAVAGAIGMAGLLSTIAVLAIALMVAA